MCTFSFFVSGRPLSSSIRMLVRQSSDTFCGCAFCELCAHDSTVVVCIHETTEASDVAQQPRWHVRRKQLWGMGVAMVQLLDFKHPTCSNLHSSPGTRLSWKWMLQVRLRPRVITRRFSITCGCCGTKRRTFKDRMGVHAGAELQSCRSGTPWNPLKMQECLTAPLGTGR